MLVSTVSAICGRSHLNERDKRQQQQLILCYENDITFGWIESNVPPDWLASGERLQIYYSLLTTQLCILLLYHIHILFLSFCVLDFYWVGGHPNLKCSFKQNICIVKKSIDRLGCPVELIARTMSHFFSSYYY